MKQKIRFLNAGEAARRLGVSAKALRLYERHGLLMPDRNRAGWRIYGPALMERGVEVVSLRKLGLGLAEIATLLASQPALREGLLATHQSHLQAQMQELSGRLRSLSEKRTDRRAVERDEVSFDLPWPWGGERFFLPAPASLTFITGPLGSGKTRLAKRLSEVLADARFLGLDRFDDRDSHLALLEADMDLKARCRHVLHVLEADGATVSPALAILVAALCSGTDPLVIDMVEQRLDHATQSALIAHLRRRNEPVRPLFLMTRSSAILDLSMAESGETIIYCPANHAPPMIVRPDPLTPGYEAVATCLASPEVRARTSDVIAIHFMDRASIAS